MSEVEVFVFPVLEIFAFYSTSFSFPAKMKGMCVNCRII